MGGLIRLLEFMYLGAPLHSILRAGRTSTLEYIEHLPGVLEHMSQSNHNMKELTKVPKGNRPPYLVLKNARIHLKTGIVALNSGHFFTNRLEFQDFSSGYHYSHLRELQHSKPLILPGKFIPLALQTYYFHFLIEDLPALLLAFNANVDSVIITPPSQPKYVTETLSKLNCPILIIDDKIVEPAEVIIPDRIKGTTPEDFAKTIQLLTNRTSNLPPDKKLLLMRGNRPRGNTDIESRLLETLLPLGFEAVDPGEMKIDDQANLFTRASQIVSLHGGGLTNLIFCQKETTVFEVHSHVWRNFAYPTLAEIFGLNYMGADDSNFETRLKEWLQKNA